jgi:hypothetical protein
MRRAMDLPRREPAMPGRSPHARERLAILVAVLVHATAGSVAYRMRVTPPRDRELSPERLAAPELTVVDLEPAPRPVPAETARVASSVASVARGAARSVDAPRATGPSGPSDGVEPVVNAPTGSWSFSPLTEPAHAELAMGTARYRVAVPDAPDTVSTAMSLDDGHDVALGVGRGGPVRSAVEEAVSASASGMLGMATFDVTVDRSGKVLVDLVDARGDSAPWEHVRDPIRQLVERKPVRLPEQGRGLRVRVHVEATEKLADGRDVRSLGTSGGGTLGQVGTDSVAMKEMPNVHLEHRGKVCTARVAVGPTGGDLAAQTDFGSDSPGAASLLPSLLTPLTVGGGCSPENIGSPAQRRVAARVVGETVL